MLIILEGPDGAGKTTLANELAKSIESIHRRAVHVMHKGVPTQHPLDEYLRPLIGYRPNHTFSYVLDRWHWGENVYPSARNRKTELDAPSWWAIESYLNKLGAIVVRCSQYAHEYKRVLTERGDRDGDIDQYAELPRVDMYFDITEQNTQLPVLSYNWAASGPSKIGEILRIARMRELNAQMITDWVTYIGPLKPDLLLVGNVRHNYLVPDIAPHSQNDPAFMPFKATSGHFLLEAVIPYVSYSFGLVNACDVDDIADVITYHSDANIVALGKNAARRLHEVGAKNFGTVPHPQYVRRFHHRKLHAYSQIIEQAARERRDFTGWPTSSPEKPGKTSTSRSSSKSDAEVAPTPAATAT